MQQLNLSEKYPGYFHKWVFRTMFISLVIVAGYLLITNGGIVNTYVSYSCPAGGPPCNNPFKFCLDNPVLASLNYDCEFYNSYGCQGDLCLKRELAPGESIGERPPLTLVRFPYILLVHILIALLINHGVYMYGRKNKGNN